MHVRSAATPQEIQEAIRLIRPTHFWLKFMAANWYASLICILVIGVDVNAVMNHRLVKLGPSALMLAIGAALIGYSWYRWNAKLSKSFQAANTRIDDLSLDADGIRIKVNTGTSTFVPWSSYEKWTEGKSVFLLSGKDGTTILPIDEGSRDAIRGLLMSNVS
jgi:hypothetical protein